MIVIITLYAVYFIYLSENFTKNVITISRSRYSEIKFTFKLDEGKQEIITELSEAGP